MEIIKEKISGNKNNLESVELINKDKHMKMSLGTLGFLNVKFYYDDSDKDLWFQENFEINKEDGDVYDLVEGLFLSYGGIVFFSSENSSLELSMDKDKYNFTFMRDLSSKEISCDFIDSSIENDSLKRMFIELQDSKYDNVVKKETGKRLNKAK